MRKSALEWTGGWKNAEWISHCRYSFIGRVQWHVSSKIRCFTAKSCSRGSLIFFPCGLQLRGIYLNLRDLSTENALAWQPSSCWNMKGDIMPVREGESLRRGKKVLKHKKMLQFWRSETPSLQLISHISKKRLLRHGKVAKRQHLAKSRAEGIFRVAKLEDLHLTPSSPYETSGAEILSKWVPTHSNYFAITLRFLKNPKNPQKGFEGHPFFEVMSRKRTMERQRISSSGQRETKGSYSWKWGVEMLP